MAKIMKISKKDEAIKAKSKQRAAEESDDEDDEDEEEESPKSNAKSSSNLKAAIKQAIEREEDDEAEPTDPDELDDDELEGEVLRMGAPHTAADQRRVLKMPTSPPNKALLASAKAKVAAAEGGEDGEPLSKDEIKEYLRFQRSQLKAYGRVQLTPKNLDTAKSEMLMKATLEKNKSGDTVRVTMFETIDPAPQVGRINIPRDFGYEKLEKGQTYMLPHNVALVIAEGHKGAIHE